MVKTHFATESIAALVVEPIQGEGGFIVPPKAFLEGLRAICDEHGIVFVVDEVQSGFGRTGTHVAIEHFGVEPDLMLCAKSIAAGMPLSASSARRRSWTAARQRHRRHVPGQPGRAAQAALAVLDVFEDEGLVERAAAIGETIRARMLESWQGRVPADRRRPRPRRDARDRARRRPETKQPAPELASAVVERGTARGLLLLKTGIDGNCIRVLVPLVISDAELDEALQVWEESACRGARPR